MTDQEKLNFLLQFIAAGTRVLSARLALFSALGLAFSLFAWAMYMPGDYRLATATLFAVLVFLPVLRLDSKSEADRKAIQGE